MNILFGIQRRQWLLIFASLSFPLLLNLLGIQQAIGLKQIYNLFTNVYIPNQPNMSPISIVDLLPDFIRITAFLGLIAWIFIIISCQSFFQKQRLWLKLFQTLLLSLLIGKIFDIATVFMSIAWLASFYDIIGLFPVSPFIIEWSPRIIFPITAIILFIAFTLSRNKSLESVNIIKPVTAA